MRVRIPMMIDDPQSKKLKELREFHDYVCTREEELFLDGPVTRRVAVLDFDPETGALRPGAKFLPPTGKGRFGRFGAYQIDDIEDIYGRQFVQVSVFATVLNTMYLFEEPDVLGRRLRWAFDAPQLLVVPRAGAWANAFYERESHSLQFFFIPRGLPDGRAVYTSLSRDIVSHETAHAILDGIAPALYNAVTPQSLALHEAVADLTALLMSFRSRKLREAVLKETNESIADSTAFTDVAGEFAMAREPGSRSHFLRSMLNNKTLDRDDKSVDPRTGQPNRVNRYEPHALSEVLSGALYTVMVNIHNTLRKEGMTGGKALFVGGERFKRMILRAMDYLPPGEVSFADYGRAIIAADQASHPRNGRERKWLCREFVRRAMVPDEAALRVRTNFAYRGVGEVDLQTLLESDWAAYEFASRNRKFLGIPADVPFEVHPRLDANKTYFHRPVEEADGGDAEEAGGERDREAGGRRQVRELIFKVSWNHDEPNVEGSPVPPTRQVTAGTTVAIDWETRHVRAKLTSDLSRQQRSDRDVMLRKLLDDGVLRVGDEAVGPDGKQLCGAIRAEAMDGVMRVKGAARMLHICTT